MASGTQVRVPFSACKRPPALPPSPHRSLLLRLGGGRPASWLQVCLVFSVKMKHYLANRTFHDPAWGHGLLPIRAPLAS